MTTPAVNVCHGWSCVLVTKCAISDFNHERAPGTWTRHFQSPNTGDACEYFEPVNAQPIRSWGIGALDDND